MSSKRPGLIRRLLGAFWRALDATRRFVFNLVFLLLLVLLVGAFFAGGGRTKILEDTALVVNLQGKVVEEFTGSAREAEFAQALGGEPREAQLRDVVAVIDGAARDPKITRMVLLLEDMGHAGMPKLRSIAAAIDRFKASGKQVLAWASNFDQGQYFLASHASEVYLHPMGSVGIMGFGGFLPYFHDALEKLGVTVNVYRAGKYKSAVEPLTSNGPSKEAAEEDAFWLNDAWAEYTGEVERERHLSAGTIAALISDLPARMLATGGDAARFALDEKLVDGIKTRDELRALLIERGKPDPENKTFRQISMEEYRAQVEDTGDRARQVAIVVAEGNISDGTEPQGSIGGRSTADLVRRAREDSAVKALVLRVDSPGGSVLGSELIRRELELTRKGGKPVVVSMSDLAASGGYWISTAADRVLADPATITGSIGVFGLLPTAERGLEKIGIHTGGTTTTWLAGAGNPARPVDPRLAAVIQSSIGYTYKEFIARTSEARHLSPEQVQEIAQGRVWTGKQAKERGLVDDLGGLDAAVRAAAGLAKLADGYRTVYVESEPKGWNRILASLPLAAVHTLVGDLGLQWALAPGAAGNAVGFGSEVAWLARMSVGPSATYVYCFCQAP